MDGKATEIMVTLQLIQAAVPNFRCYPVVVMICGLSTAIMPMSGCTSLKHGKRSGLLLHKRCLSKVGPILRMCPWTHGRCAISLQFPRLAA
jgi:hypothetical protein